MLKGLDPRLNADLLHALMAMGHGDDLVLVDANFPADSVARQTRLGRPLSLENLTLPQALAAILTLYPLDDFVPDALARMEVVGDEEAIPEVQAEAQAVVDAAEGRHRPFVGLERHAFYARAATAYAIVRTGERRFYGNVALRKGVIAPETARPI
ncbi:RbsD/FucU family protein [Prosthecodimorpha staleyi]|uniref:Ribose ABC transporter n=1 Tax=Prosthecodimorpha staleyi TaxID=2840188 RepID=A0A947DB03_9HYPH|nr:RbsD/FucU domain-containing protein [Prosthecodimorpha staleyi]MBT9292122.1 ribose ABC transporter [Prosthecodimorpha staleyi]